ncbi:hypothetical protein MIR68_004578 [Amoeboaphelidium protococcarum]|nr:hypothetical protein MIR68_004578 [Amoeboaphelidium protococcarum]
MVQPETQQRLDQAKVLATEATDYTKEKVERGAADVARTSSLVDPVPHYTLSGACALGSAYAYTRLRNPQASMISALCSIGYLAAAQYMKAGQDRLAYDIGALTSAVLVVAKTPQAYRLREPYSAVLASLGGVSLFTNAVKGIQIRNRRPREYKAHF